MLDACFRVGYRLAWLGLRGFFFVVRPRIRAGVVLVRWDGKLLLITNSYRAGRGFPGGMLKWREDPAQGARRELEEETGLGCTRDALRFVGVFPREEWRAKILLHVYGLDFEEEPSLEIDGREVVAAEFYSVQAAVRLLPESRDLIEAFAEMTAELVRSPAEDA